MTTPDPGRRARRPVPRRVLAVAIGLVLACGSAELATRVLLPPVRYAPPVIRDASGTEVPLADIIRRAYESDPGAGRVLSMRMCYDRPRWDYFDPEGCVPVRSNSLGLRDEEVGARVDGELRVLALGDSFTFGMGVRAEDTWVEQLERLWAAERDGPVQVINAGFAGGAHEPVGYAHWLLESGLALDPDVVIIGFCLNDIHRNVMMAKLPPRLSSHWFGGRSQLVAHLQEALHARTYRLREARNAARRRERERGFVTTAGGAWDRARDALRRMGTELEAAGVRLVVAVLPMATHLAGDYPYDLLHEEVVAFCGEEGLEVVDLREPVFAFARGLGSYDEADLWVHPTDQHPVPALHRVYAEGILAYLRVGATPQRTR